MGEYKRSPTKTQRNPMAAQFSGSWQQSTDRYLKQVQNQDSSDADDEAQKQSSNELIVQSQEEELVKNSFIKR